MELIFVSSIFLLYLCIELKKQIVMKKINVILLIIVMSLLVYSLVSCENELDVKTDLQNLKIERLDLQGAVNGNRAMLSQLKITVKEYNKQIETLRIERNMVRQNKEPQYILKLKLKQSHFSIDPMKHIKDGMNAIKFELPVSKDFYNRVSIGTNIIDDFRMGSFILNGSFGDWKMTVEDKEIR